MNIKAINFLNCNPSFSSKKIPNQIKDLMDKENKKSTLGCFFYTHKRLIMN